MAFEFWDSEDPDIPLKESVRLRIEWLDFIRSSHWKWAYVAGPSRQMELMLCYFDGKFDCPAEVLKKADIIRGGKTSLTAHEKLIRQIRRKRKC